VLHLKEIMQNVSDDI